MEKARTFMFTVGLLTLPGMAMAQGSEPPPPVTSAPETPAWLEALQSLATQQVLEVGGKLGLALLLLLLGWVAAKLVSLLVFRLLQRTTWDDWIAD